MVCSHCGGSIEEGSNVCPACGRPAAKGRCCPKCGQASEPGWEFCAACGASLAGKPRREPSPSSAIRLAADTPRSRRLAHRCMDWCVRLGALAGIAAGLGYAWGAHGDAVVVAEWIRSAILGGVVGTLAGTLLAALLGVFFP